MTEHKNTCQVVPGTAVKTGVRLLYDFIVAHGVRVGVMKSMVMGHMDMHNVFKLACLKQARERKSQFFRAVRRQRV